jgi:integrase
MIAKLTERFIKTITPKSTPYEIRDTEINGFILRIEPTGTLIYYLVYRITTGAKKRYKIGRHGSITVTQARDMAKQFSAKAISGQDLQEEKKKAILEKEKIKTRTLEKFIELHYAPWVLVERKTGIGTINRLNLNFSSLMKLSLEEISALLIEKWRTEQLKLGKVAATVNRDVATLKAVLSKAVSWDLLEASPLAKLKPLKTDNMIKVRYLSIEEEKRLLTILNERDKNSILSRESGNIWRSNRGYDLLPSLNGHSFFDYMTPMILTAMHTGLRQGELFSLRWDHVDFNKAIITVAGNKAKNGKTRHVPLNKEVLYVLSSWNKQCSNYELVFPSKEGNQINNVRKSWCSILKKANIINFRWHDLRHHFASRLVMAGVDLNTVRELLGHSDLKVTLRYAHLAPEHKAEAVAKLTNYIPSYKSIY